MIFNVLKIEFEFTLICGDLLLLNFIMDFLRKNDYLFVLPFGLVTLTFLLLGGRFDIFLFLIHYEVYL